MKPILLLCLVLLIYSSQAQTNEYKLPIANIRLSLLVFPPVSPLLTFELSTFKNCTIQLETNFVNTHGTNLKYFLKNSMDKDYIFIGMALLENKLLRADKKITFLPYAGYGYAHRFGNKKQYTFDNRIGIGSTTNADKNAVYPIIKTGIGYIF
jgi:hypothetical protein